MTDRDLVHVEARPGFPGPGALSGAGEQRLYRFRDMLGGAWGLSVVNGGGLHYYPFAREAAVIRFGSDGGRDGAGNDDFELSYSTPLSSDVEVFATDEEADEFVARARAYFVALSAEEVTALDAAHVNAVHEREENRAKLLAARLDPLDVS